MQQLLIRIYAVMLSVLFGIMFTAQILGFLGIYRPILAIPLTIIVSLAGYALYQRFTPVWASQFTPEQTESKSLQSTLIVSSVTLVLLIFVQRIVLWYQSSVGQTISADFFGYHGIKILQLVREGSVWDLSIPYGQYPFGLESLVAFLMLFMPDIRLMGLTSAYVFVILWLTIALLLVRFGRYAIDVSVLLAVGICFVPLVFPQLLNVGKNDVLLSTLILVAILHAPLGDNRFHPIGLAFATMGALATKATGLYVLFYLWGLVMLNWAWQYRNRTWRDYLHPITFLTVILVMFPGGLWVIRNYSVLGTVFTSEITLFFQTTIISNLDNQWLYQSAQSALLRNYFIFAIIAGIAGVFYKSLGWQMLGLIIAIIFTFMVTPLAAFLTPNNLDYLDVQWRFVLHGLILLWIIGLTVISPIAHHAYAWMNDNQALSTLASIGVVGLTLVIISGIGVDDLFATYPNQWEKVIDPTLQEDSIYDAIAELEESTIYIQVLEGLSVRLRNPNLTITELRYPLGQSDIYPVPDLDYFAIHSSALEAYIPEIVLAYDWELVYDHPTGRIYRLSRER